MSLYDYKCQKCSYLFEKKQSIKDKPLRKCPECGKLALQRIISEPIYMIMEPSVPKTYGSQSDLNMKEIKKGNVQKEPDKRFQPKAKPWWRSDKKVKMDALKNPTKYINTGEV